MRRTSVSSADGIFSLVTSSHLAGAVEGTKGTGGQQDGHYSASYPSRSPQHHGSTSWWRWRSIFPGRGGAAFLALLNDPPMIWARSISAATVLAHSNGCAMSAVPAKSGFVVTFLFRNECYSFGVEGERTTA